MVSCESPQSEITRISVGCMRKPGLWILHESRQSSERTSTKHFFDLMCSERVWGSWGYSICPTKIYGPFWDGSQNFSCCLSRNLQLTWPWLNTCQKIAGPGGSFSYSSSNFFDSFIRNEFPDSTPKFLVSSNFIIFFKLIFDMGSFRQSV